MTEESYRKWDILAKSVAPVVTIVGILVGIWQFSKDQSAQLERQYKLAAQNDKLEFRRKVWEKQMEVYTKIGEVVGRISGADETKEKLAADVGLFNALYWGNMIYVEDEAVEAAMKDFQLELNDFLKGISTKDRLKIRGDLLLKACRDSSSREWFADAK